MAASALFVQGSGSYDMILSISLFLLAIVVNGTLGMKTGKISNEKYYMQITPPGWAFSIWGIIYLSTFLALLYSCYYNTWSHSTHIYFQIYCVINALWIVFWCSGNSAGLILSTIDVFVYAITLFILWDSIQGNLIVKQIIAFQLGWVASAQTLNFSAMLVYIFNVKQETLHSLIWIFLLLSHGTYIYLASAKINEFIGYFFSMSWALFGVSTSFLRLILKKKNVKL